MYSQNKKRRRSLKALSWGICVTHMLMGYLVFRTPPELYPLFDYAFDAARPAIWGTVFALAGAIIFVGHVTKNHKPLYEAHYFSAFLFFGWGITMLLSTLRDYVFTSGYPLVCIVAGLGSIAVANSIAPTTESRK